MSIKDVRSQGVVQCGYFADKWLFRCGRPHFLVQKTSDFRNLWCVRNKRGGGVSQYVHLRTRREGSIFCDFVRPSFMDGLLL